jgi:hypothetical protein
MKVDHQSEEAQKRLMVLVEEMSGESDRTVAIVGAAWVEEALGNAIESFLQSHSEAWKRLFKGAGPMNSFSAKIDLARLLGMVTNSIRTDLHDIRDIRNEFAHQIAHKTEHTKLSFASSQIREKCLALRCVAHEKPTDARTAFTRACATLNADFEMVVLFGAMVSDSGRVLAKGIDEA